MPRAFLSLGSNRGDRLSFLRQAVGALASVPGITVGRVSGVYETQPYGVKDQNDFYNAVAEIRTELPPHELFRTVKEIERSLGRTETVRWGPREIDIDVLLYNSEIVATPVVVIPHPELSRRRFVLIPLAEIAAEIFDPRSGLTVGEMLAQCPDSGRVEKTELRIV